MIDFNNVKHFKRYQFDDVRLCQLGSGWNINPTIVKILDDIVEHTGWVAVPYWSVYGCVVMDDAIHDARLCKSPWHLRENGCKAIDFHFETEASPVEQITTILNSDVTGIGLFKNIALATNVENMVRYLDIAFHIDIGEKERKVWGYPDYKPIDIEEFLNIKKKENNYGSNY